ncbi:MAG: PDZ domain-containing protein [Anaerolineaceae bacterium]|nr:PDZ domain-containing protein [Anaerolineaceae bacterium]
MRIIPAILVLTLLMGGAVLAQETGERPFLGIAFSVEDDGALVREVQAGSPAEDAGLLVDDLITGVNGADVAPEELAATIQALAIGEQISLTVLRDGEELELDVTLGSATTPVLRWQAFRDSAFLGVSLVSGEAGVLVQDVLPESPAAQAGLQTGDLLRSINDESVDTPLQAAELIRALEPGAAIALGVERDGELLTLEATTGRRERMMPREGMPALSEDFEFRMEAGQPLLGVEYMDLNADLAAERELTQQEGALILRVLPESPAEAAGLLAEDIVVAVEGDPVDARRTLRERLLAYDPGETLQLELLRAGESMELDVTLGAGGSMPPFGFRGRMLPPGGMMDLEALQERLGEDVDFEALMEAMMEQFHPDFDMEAWLEQFARQLPEEALAPAPDV